MIVARIIHGPETTFGARHFYPEKEGVVYGLPDGMNLISLLAYVSFLSIRRQQTRRRRAGLWIQDKHADTFELLETERDSRFPYFKTRKEVDIEILVTCLFPEPQ